MVIRSKKGIHVLRNAQQFKPIQWPSQPIEEEEKGVWSEFAEEGLMQMELDLGDKDADR
jgi:hypothetical protein